MTVVYEYVHVEPTWELARRIWGRRMRKATLLLGTVGALLIACLPGCGDNAPEFNLEHMPRQSEAMDLVWYGVYGKNIDPPLVDWVMGGRLSCPLGESFPASDGTCAFGEFTSFNYMIHVAIKPGQTFSDVSFAHELCHAKAWAETSDSDGDHTGPCFVGLSNHVQGAQDVLTGAGL